MLLNNRFHVVKSLKADEFSETLIALDTHTTKRLCVLRCITLDLQSQPYQQSASEQFRKAAETLQTLDHDQVPKLYGCFQENNQYYIAQEWLEGPSLGESVTYAHHLPANEVHRILVELLPVLTYIHDQKVIHRGIKPENIILRKKDNKAVLIDFGLVKETLQTVMKTSGASGALVSNAEGFAPPEQVEGRSMDDSSDVYALGMTAIYALTGKRPQEMDSDPRTSHVLWRKHVPSIDETFAAILDKAIQANPANRYPSADAMLQHLLALKRDTGRVPLPTTVTSNDLSPQPPVTSDIPSPRPPVTSDVPSPRPPVTSNVPRPQPSVTPDVPPPPTRVDQKPWRSLPWGIPAIALASVVVASVVGLHFRSLQADGTNSFQVGQGGTIDASSTPKLTNEQAEARLIEAQRLTGEASDLEAQKNPDATEKFRAIATNLLSIPAGTSAYEQATLALANILSIEISRTQKAVEELKIDSQLNPLNLTKRSLRASDWTGSKTNIYDPQAPVVTRFGESKIQGYALRDTWAPYQKRTETLGGGRHFQAIWAEEDNNNGKLPDIWIEKYQVVPGQLDVTVMYGCMTQSVIQLEGYFSQDLGMEFMDQTLKVWLDGANADDAGQALQAVYNDTSLKERTFVADEFVGMVQRTDDGKIMVLVRG